MNLGKLQRHARGSAGSARDRSQVSGAAYGGPRTTQQCLLACLLAFPPYPLEPQRLTASVRRLFLVPGGRSWEKLAQARSQVVAGPLEMRYTQGQTAANGYPGLPMLPSAVSSTTGANLSAFSLGEVGLAFTPRTRHERQRDMACKPQRFLSCPRQMRREQERKKGQRGQLAERNRLKQSKL